MIALNLIAQAQKTPIAQARAFAAVFVGGSKKMKNFFFEKSKKQL